MLPRIPLKPLLLALLFIGSATTSVADDKSQPLKLMSQEHELIGKIYSVKDRKFVSKEELLQHVFQNDYVLLGETHDNIRHHEEHGEMITHVANHSKQAAIAFEMLNEDQEKVVNNVEFKNTDELLDTLEQAKTGWEYKKYYGPVFDSVLKAKLPMHAAEMDRKTLMDIVTKGLENAPGPVQELLKTTTLSDEATESLKKEIEMTHCGMINAEMTQAMMLGQKVRDAVIGDTLFKIKKDPVKTAILISGSGHIRKDRGAPFYLQARDKNAKIIAVAWLEIEAEVNDPLEYSKRWGVDHLPFDYVVFTDQVDRPDPCEEMKKYMDHKKNHGKKS